ncbi:MAG: hypothetical protein QW478_01940 [Candidatus Micrarchaeaceae archaeon]
MEYEIMLWVDYDSIYIQSENNVEDKNKYFDNKKFWITKALLDFRITADYFNNTFLLPHERFLQLMTYNNEVGINALQFMNIDKFVKLAITTKKDYLFEITKAEYNYTKIIYYFVKHNDIPKVRKWIRKLNIKDFSDFLPVRTLEMAELLRTYIPNILYILKENHKIIKYADIDLLKILFQSSTDLGWPYFKQLLQRPDKDVFDFMISKVNIEGYNLKYVLPYVYSTADHEYINYVLNYFNLQEDNLDPTLSLLNIAGTKNYVFFVPIFDRLKNINLINIFGEISKNTNIDILIYILNNYEISINQMYFFIYYCFKRHDIKKTLDFIINKYGKNYIIDDMINDVLSVLDVNDAVDCILTLQKNNIHLSLNLTPQFINAMNIKDKYFMDVFYNYTGIETDVVRRELLNIKDSRVIDYVINLFKEEF